MFWRRAWAVAVVLLIFGIAFLLGDLTYTYDWLGMAQR